MKLVLVWLTQKQILRQNLEGKWFIWEVMSGNNSREGKEANGRNIVKPTSLWAEFPGEHWGVCPIVNKAKEPAHLFTSSHQLPVEACLWPNINSSELPACPVLRQTRLWLRTSPSAQSHPRWQLEVGLCMHGKSACQVLS